MEGSTFVPDIGSQNLYKNLSIYGNYKSCNFEQN